MMRDIRFRLHSSIRGIKGLPTTWFWFAAVGQVRFDTKHVLISQLLAKLKRAQRSSVSNDGVTN